MLYFIILILLLLLYSFSRSRTGFRKVTIFVVVSMVLLAGFRDVSVGRDTMSYLTMYEAKWISGRIEPLFIVLIHICRSLGLSYHSFLLIVACLIYIPLYVFIRKWSCNLCLSMLVYMTFSVFFFANSFNVLRNAVSASFVLLCLSSLFEYNKKKAIVFGVIACGFHYSAIIALLIIYGSQIIRGIKPTFALILLAVSIVVGLNSSFHENLFASILQNMSFLTGDAVDNYSKYLSDITESELNGNGIIMLIVPLSLISSLSFFCDECDKRFRIILFIGTIFGNLFITVLYTYRITVYLTLTSLVVIPQLCKSNVKMIRVLSSGIILILAVYFIYNLVYNKCPNLLPYKFFFE